MTIHTDADAIRPAAATPQKPAIRRWRLASWAPVLVLVLVCAVIAVINPNFLTFGNFVRISQAVMIPLVLGLGVCVNGHSTKQAVTLCLSDWRRPNCRSMPVG